MQGLSYLWMQTSARIFLVYLGEHTHARTHGLMLTFVINQRINNYGKKFVWQELPSGLIHDCKKGSQKENHYKNRFNTILPCELVTYWCDIEKYLSQMKIKKSSFRNKRQFLNIFSVIFQKMYKHINNFFL